MNRLILLVLCWVGWINMVFPQNNIASYQYWFDDNFSGAISNTVAPEQNFNLNTDIDASVLNPGVHLFYIRFEDENALWSCPVAQFIYKIPEQNTGISTNEIAAYQYWFDDDYNNAVNQAVTPVQNFVLLSDIDAGALSPGVHAFYIRYKDSRGQWSSPVAQFIYKIPEQNTGISTNEIAAYQYWFDDDYNNAVNQPVTPVQNFVLLSDIDAGALSPGVHAFYIRYKDSRGQWSSPVAQFIYKIPVSLSIDNNIVAYRYWFDDDFENAVNLPVIPAQSIFSLTEQIDMTQMWKGEYILYYQFQDTLGMWSSPTIDTIVKNALPIAEFTYNRIENCDSTIIEFHNFSIDGDTCVWDFGDGQVSGDSAVYHTYYETGNYLVSLTVTDTLSGRDSTMTELIHIIGPTSNAISETVCDSYTAPSGTVFTETGIYNDTIPNSMSCDSVIEIDLTVLESSFAEMNVHACDSFVAPSGDVYYTTGQYYDTIPNAVGCDSIIDINLDLGTTSFATIDEDVCDAYLSPAGNIYTESGVYYDTLLNTSGCDSIIEIHLTIRESSSANLIEEVCDEFVSPAGNIYTESGVYYDTIPNAALCDSVIEINLTVLETTFSEMNVHACDSFIMPSGQILYNSGIYYDTVANTVGCDSIITFDLSITVVDTSVVHEDSILVANQEGADYQWLDCDNDMLPLDGAVSQSFIPDETGNYAVQITLNECTDTSNCHHIIVQSVEDRLNKWFRLYPNPAHGYVYIDIHQASAELIIYDVAGQKILAVDEFTGGKIDVSGYDSGIYFVEIRSEIGSGVKKLVVK